MIKYSGICVGLERSRANYSPTGYYLALQTLQRRMETRLQMALFIKKHPTVLDTEFSKSPMFVIGFPRTGTTFLHELLGLHPAVRMHYTWEQMDPVPGTDREDDDSLNADRKRRYDGISSVIYISYQHEIQRLTSYYLQRQSTSNGDVSEAWRRCDTGIPINLEYIFFY